MSDDFNRLSQELIEAGRFIDQKGWVPATSGNFSARLPNGRIAITVSGRHKGALIPSDIMLIDAEGISLDGQTSSAETGLHTALYRRFQKVGSVLHPHSPGATLLSRLRKDEVVLENYELLKAFDGINTHATRIRIPIFDNDQDIPRLQRAVDAWLDREPDPHAYIIRSHGFYTWGATIKDALRQVEALEYLLDIESRLSGATPA
jgi:methylthioribulose-1-phosphate dehydratase